MTKIEEIKNSLPVSITKTKLAYLCGFSLDTLRRRCKKLGVWINGGALSRADALTIIDTIATTKK